MSLVEIKRYFMQVKMASLESLAHYFGCEQDVLRGMLNHWIRKGLLCPIISGNCGSCTQCPAKKPELYRWVG